MAFSEPLGEYSIEPSSAAGGVGVVREVGLGREVDLDVAGRMAVGADDRCHDAQMVSSLLPLMVWIVVPIL